MKIVAVTSCPSGVAHTYLAAESLEVAAKEKGIEIAVETQGSIGIENELDKNIGIKNEERFKGKPVVRVSAGDCINKAGAIMAKLKEKFG